MSSIAVTASATGTGTVSLVAPVTNTDRTITLPDVTGTAVTTGSTAVVSQAMLATNVAGNGPAFSAGRTTDQSVSAATYTKVLYTTEDFDTNNCFASSTFTPTVAGYYQINVQLGFNSTGESLVLLYKNGAIHRSGNDLVGTVYGLVLSTLVYANGTTDYFEVYGYPGAGTTFYGSGNGSTTYFQGFLARAA
jgi:hypothetical protein